MKESAKSLFGQHWFTGNAIILHHFGQFSTQVAFQQKILSQQGNTKT